MNEPDRSAGHPPLSVPPYHGAFPVIEPPRMWQVLNE